MTSSGTSIEDPGGTKDPGHNSVAISGSQGVRLAAVFLGHTCRNLLPRHAPAVARHAWDLCKELREPVD